MTRGERIVLLGMVILLILVCGADYSLYALRSRHHNVVSYVYVSKYIAVSDGNGHYHFAHYANMDVSCVRSLLPHRTLWPCWWVRFNRDDWVR
jgi:hypothetical protein